MKIKKLWLLIICVMFCSCNRSGNVFEQSSIRFFPSALYYYGDSSNMMYSFAEQRKSSTFHILIQFLANDKATIDNLRKDIHHATIKTKDGFIDASISLFNDEKLSGYQGKTSSFRSVKGNYAGFMDVSFNTDFSIDSQEVILHYQNGETSKLDCLVDIELNSIGDQTAITNPNYINTIRNNENGALLSSNMKISDVKNLDESKLTSNAIKYNEQAGKIILSEDSKIITFHENSPWRTTSFFCYIHDE